MHRQLRAERNFSSYPWVDVFDSPAAAAGGAQADTAPNDNARPRHSAPDRLVLFIRSPPPNGPPLRCDTPPAYRSSRRSAHPKREYGSSNGKNVSPRAAVEPCGDGVFSHLVGWPAASPACERRDRHNAGTVEKAPPRATRRQTERKFHSLLHAPRWVKPSG